MAGFRAQLPRTDPCSDGPGGVVLRFSLDAKTALSVKFDPVSLPLELERFLAEPRIAVLATVRGDGAPATTACWYDLEQGRLLITMYASARRLPNIRRNPRVAMTILGEDPYQHVSLSGSIAEMWARLGPPRLGVVAIQGVWRGG